MNKLELLKKLEKFPDNMEIMIVQTDFYSTYVMAESVDVKPVVFGSDDVPRDEWATVDCIVISDEI